MVQTIIDGLLKADNPEQINLLLLIKKRTRRDIE